MHMYIIYTYVCIYMYRERESMYTWVHQPTNSNNQPPVEHHLWALVPRHVVMRLRCASASMRSSERRAEVNSLSMVRTLPPQRRRRTKIWRFLEIGYPNSWMMYNGTSYSNGWFGGFPYFRKPIYIYNETTTVLILITYHGLVVTWKKLATHDD